MALSKLAFKPGINKEITRYSAEGGWYSCDKVRFRQGFPEKMGGWQRLSNNTFRGICRSIFTWSNLSGIQYRAIGTNLKLYIESGGTYYDITPIRDTSSAGDATFSITNGSSTITVSESNHGAIANDFVTFSNAATLGTSNITAAVLNKEYQITEIIDNNTYEIIALDADDEELIANETVSGGGGASTIAEYQITTGNGFGTALEGWSAGGFGEGAWGETTDPQQLVGTRFWSFGNFGEDLIAGPKGGGLYVWDSSAGLSTRATLIKNDESEVFVPDSQNFIFVSDANRFVFCLGTNDVASPFDPMLVRWSDQESYFNWLPSITNQSGSLRLSRGNVIKAVNQSRQEVLVWTDTSLFSLQYLGAPIVWGSQLVGDNLTIVSQNASAYASGAIFWMGEDQFFVYSGQVQTLPCDLQRHVFSNINRTTLDQIFAGTNEKFGEIWWFYCSENSDTIDSYVVYNYVQQIWYNGTLARTAWESKGSVVAATYNNRIVQHEIGNNDEEFQTPAPINATITSAPIDIGDGDKFSFVWRVLPDITFRGSNCEGPNVSMTLYGMKNAGSGYNDPASEGGVNSKLVTKAVCLDVEEFTEQINVRVRGRQLVFEISSNALDVSWQLGFPRIDIRADGKQ